MKCKKIYVISLIFVVLFQLSGCKTLTDDSIAQSVGIKYNLYIGLNDKDTYEQEISTEDAERLVTEIALKYVDGFTQTTAKGSYKDEKGVVTYENSLVYSFASATEEQIKNIMDEVLTKLNQNSILIEKEKVNYDFYEGGE